MGDALLDRLDTPLECVVVGIALQRRLDAFHFHQFVERTDRVPAPGVEPDRRNAQLRRQIDATDREIDRLVYDLYGLTEDEIKIVEAASVESSPNLKENGDHETEPEPANRPGSGRSATATVAQAARYAREGGGGTPERPVGTREPVHGVREPTGQYGTPEDLEGNDEAQSALSSTREFDTAEGRLSYSVLSERLAVPLVAIYDDLLQTPPDEIRSRISMAGSDVCCSLPFCTNSRSPMWKQPRWSPTRGGSI